MDRYSDMVLHGSHCNCRAIRYTAPATGQDGNGRPELTTYLDGKVEERCTEYGRIDRKTGTAESQRELAWTRKPRSSWCFRCGRGEEQSRDFDLSFTGCSRKGRWNSTNQSFFCPESSRIRRSCNSLRRTGLLRYSLAPASIQRSRSPGIASPVIAMIGRSLL